MSDIGMDLNGRMGALEGRMSTVEGRMMAVEGRMGAIEDRMGTVEGRLSRLEGAVEGMRHSLSITLAAVAATAAILVGLNAYMVQRIDAIPSALQQTISTLSAAITAAKQQPAFVVTVPVSPAPPPAK